MLLTVQPFLVRINAKTIYLNGTNRLTARDGYAGIPTDYYVPVEQYAAATFTAYQLNYAKDNGYISQQEYDETMSYV